MTASVPKHIVVASDLDEHSAVVLRAAQALAAPLGSRITLVHVLEIPPVPPGLDALALEGLPVDWEDRLLRSRLQTAKQRLEQLAKSCADAATQLETQIFVGRLPEALLAELPGLHADLLVVGTHGRRGVAHFFLGSVAERLMRTASCPVLVVRPGANADAATS